MQAAPIGADRVLRRDELDRILKVATEHDAAFLRFLWRTGARVSELTGLRLEQCERQGAVVRLRVVGKGNKERFLRVKAALFDQIRETFKGSTYLFETRTGQAFSRVYVSTRIHRLAENVLGRKLGAHALRHSFATWTIRRTGQDPGGQYLPRAQLHGYHHELLRSRAARGRRALRPGGRGIGGLG